MDKNDIKIEGKKKSYTVAKTLIKIMIKKTWIVS